MFQVGDAVVHPVNGAGIIAGLQNYDIQQESLRYYKIQIIGRTDTVVMVPIQQAEELGLRYAISEVKLKQVWGVLSSQPQELPSEHKKRYRELESKIKTQDTLEIAEVVRDLEWRRLQEERLNVPGKRIYDKAMRLLASEIAVSQGIALQEAQDKIQNVVQKNLAPRYKKLLASA